MRLRLRLTPRLTVTFALFAVALVAALATFAYFRARAALQEATLAALAMHTAEESHHLDHWIGEGKRSVAAIASSTAVREEVDLLLASREPAASQVSHDRLVQELRP
ncbi:unnamed protein product, partial [marine sediment metagenome]